MICRKVEIPDHHSSTEHSLQTNVNLEQFQLDNHEINKIQNNLEHNFKDRGKPIQSAKK